MKYWPLRDLANADPLRFFLVVAAVFGLMFLLVTPPFEGADELVHFYRAYQVSEGTVLAYKNTQGKIGGELPASIESIINDTESSTVMFHPQLKYREGWTKLALSVPTDGRQQKFYEFAAAAPYAPTTYAGVSTGIIVARVLHLPMMVIFYAARLGNLLSWLVLIGTAIYFIPKRKWLLASFGLIPMALFQASTVNGDAVTIGSVALLLALILYFRDKNRMLSVEEFGLLLAVAIVMVLTKEIMFLFVPLLLMLKKENWGVGRRAVAAKIVLWAVPLICFACWMYAIRGVNTTTAYVNGQNPAEQVSAIIHNPFAYASVLWNTYFYTWGDSITRSFIGTFGWSDTPLSELLVTAGYIGLSAIFVASVPGEETTWLSKKDKLLLLGVIIMYWLATSTALYVAFTPVHFKIVYGLQGRYFLPLALLAIPLLKTKHIRIDKRLYGRIVTLLPPALLICSAFTVYVRYFIRNV